MLKARVAVLVSGGGTNLGALIKAQQEGRLPHAELALVISSNSQAYALQRAEAANIPSIIVERKSCASQAEFEAQLHSALQEHNIDLVVLAGFMHILSPWMISNWPGRMVNVHPSLIPAFCGEGFYGLRVHAAALERGVKLTGATVHLVNEIADGGRILAQKAVEVLPEDTAQSLQQRVMEQAEWLLLPQVVEQLCAELCAEQ